MSWESLPSLMMKKNKFFMTLMRDHEKTYVHFTDVGF